MGSFAMPFYIGHHDAQRKAAVTDELYEHAQDLGYNTLTSRITNENYQPRVMFQLSKHMQALEAAATSQPGVQPPPLVVGQLNATETDLFPSWLASKLLHLASPWIDIASSDPVIADVSRQVLEQEVSYAAFCGVTDLLIQGPAPGASEAGLAKFARALRKSLELAPSIQFSVALPMSYAPQSQREPSFADLTRFVREDYAAASANVRPNQDLLSSWDVWEYVRSFCKYPGRLSVALTVPHHLPPMETQNRWYSEPIRLLQFPRSTFTPNKMSVEVLAKPHQNLIMRYLRLRTAPWFLLSDIGPLPDDDPSERGSEMHGDPDPTPAEASKQKPAVHPSQKPLAHLEYFRHLQSRQPLPTPLERYGQGYQDYPQTPLQPLADDLESVTYEVFEKDPIKYEWYENAVKAALNDWKRFNKPRSLNNKVVIAVVGAGRGPLVERSLNAAEKAQVDVEIWAVEKNPSAFVHLHRRKIHQWGDRVHLYGGDMRKWPGPQFPSSSVKSSVSSTIQSEKMLSTHVDILVSELLGSFADNELSPECLDGAQRFLQPKHGVSIPTNYTSFLTPISAPRLWSDIRSRGKMPSGTESTSIPYVAWLHAIDFLSTEPGQAPLPAPQADGPPPPGQSPSPPKLTDPVPVPIVKDVWSFFHPVPDTTFALENAHNTRFAHLTFPAPHRGVCHGLGGYFESVLYESKATSQHSSGSSSGITAGKNSNNSNNGKETAMPWSSTTKPRHGKIELSTHPVTMHEKSPDMISWFPIFFPLKDPLYVPDDAEIAVSMWRQTDGRKVWYEWLVEVWISTGGHKVRTGTSGLMSSETEGCLM